MIRALEPVARATRRDGIDEPTLFPWPEPYSEALVGAGRLDAAASFLPAHEALAADRGVRTAQLQLARVRGRLEAAQARPKRAEAAFRTALDLAEELGLPFDRALSEHACGRFLRRQGSRRAAADCCAPPMRRSPRSSPSPTWSAAHASWRRAGSRRPSGARWTATT